MMAARFNYVPLVERLLAAGADVNLLDKVIARKFLLRCRDEL